MELAALMDVEVLSSVVCFVMLCAACSPSPCAIPLAAFFIWGVDDQDYQATLNLFGGHWNLVAFGVTGAAIVSYWINGLLLLYIDVIHRPKVITQFKIQADPAKDFDLSKIGKVVKNIIIGQLFVIIPCGIIYAALSEHGIGLYKSDVLPPKREQAMHMIGYVLIDEVVFYYGHCLLHQQSFKLWPGAKPVNLYRKYHKIHHEFQAPVGLVASYCHPLEMFLSNVLPLTGGMVIMNSHVFTGFTWAIFAVLGTQTHHCGYRWPWVPGFDHQPCVKCSDFHDFHHMKVMTNYGLTGWLDALHGTDKLWKEHLKEKAQAAKGGKWQAGASGDNAMYAVFTTIFFALVGVSYFQVPEAAAMDAES